MNAEPKSLLTNDVAAGERASGAAASSPARNENDTVGDLSHPGKQEQVGTSSVTPVQRAGRPADERYDFLSPPQSADELGRLDGYRILRVLGEGGMGVVFEAHDEKLDRHVAIKVVRPGEADGLMQKRFMQEARLAASLSSDHIVTIYQVGQHGDALYMVMELLAGETLEARLERQRSLPVAEALRIAREVAEGLAVAHEKHLIHRDIKPANIWLRSKRASDPYCHVKLLDFGIARPIVLREQLTTQGHVVGTPNFMSPEQACGLQLDERSDLFSLGCLMYAMLSGRPPFARDSEIMSLRAVVNDELPSIRNLVPNLPTPAVQLIERLLNKSPQARPATARQVVETIRRIERSVSHGDAKAPNASLTTDSKLPLTRRDKLGWGAGAGALVILLAIGLGGWMQYHRITRGEAVNGHPLVPEVPTALAASAVPAAAAPQAPPASPELPAVRVGIVHSLSGPMAASERCIVDAFLLAVDELNESGGVLGGRRIEAIVRDGRSNELTFAEEAEKLIQEENVSTLFGCWRSPCRKAVEEVCRRYNHLLIYPTTYEGLEQSPYIVYMGGAPNQQVLPAVKWAFAFQGKRKFFLVGADGIYSHGLHEIIKDELKTLGATVAGERFKRLGELDFNDVAAEIKSSGADVVLNTVSGIGNASLFQSLRAAGILAAEVPTISFRVTEEELRTFALAPSEMAGDYAAWSYFQSLDREENHNLIERFRDRFGASRVINDPMVAAFTAMYFWGSAVDAAKSIQPADIRRAIVDLNFEAPEGLVAIDPENQHALRSARIGQITQDLDFEIVWTSPKPIEPEPFPQSRSVEEWQQFEQRLFESWGQRWRPEPAGAVK